MPNDEECIKRMAETLRRALEHERKDNGPDDRAVMAAVGAFFDDPRVTTAKIAKERQPPSP
jgi:hypothetical protein